MKRPGVFSALLLASLVLNACSKFLQVTLFNNTGGAIEIHAESKNATIAPNQFERFKYPGESAKGVFHLSSGGCEYLYEFSPKLDDYGLSYEFERGVQIQVEKDFSIELLPVSYKGNFPASGEIILKHEGFPLHPVSQKCG